MNYKAVATTIILRPINHISKVILKVIQNPHMQAAEDILAKEQVFFRESGRTVEQSSSLGKKNHLHHCKNIYHRFIGFRRHSIENGRGAMDFTALAKRGEMSRMHP